MIEFIIYLLVVTIAIIGIGVWGYKIGKKTAVDYMIAGGMLGFVASYFWVAFVIYSAWTFFGFAGYLYLRGPAYHLFPLMAHLGFAIAIWTIGRKLLKSRAKYGVITPIEALAKRYGSNFVRLMLSVVLITFIVPYIGLQITSIGATLQTFVGVPYLAGVLYMAALMLILIYLGGMRSVAWANVMWGIIMTVAFLGSLVWVVSASGTSIPEMAISLYEKDPVKMGLGYYTIPFAIGLAIAGITVFCWPHVLQATLGMRDEKVLKKVVLAWLVIGGFVVYLGAYLWGNIVAAYLSPGLTGKAADVAVLVTIKKFTPDAWVMFVILGILAAAISTSATQLMTAAIFTSNDLIGAVRKTMKDEAKILWTRVICILVVILSTIFAYFYPVEIGRMLDAIASPGYSMITAALLGLFWKRGTKEGVIAATIGGVLLLVCGFFYPPLTLGTHPVVVPLFVSLVIFFIVSLVTPPPSEEDLEIFFEEVQKPEAK
uniref:Sodium:solute symporter family protein n=1 Tax=Fervidobacterium pennivorans TaxID=93466 RepID=A0A7V4KDG7_FERPE